LAGKTPRQNKRILIESTRRISEAGGVSKPALGRGLGSLMGGSKPPEAGEPPAGAQPAPASSSGAGLGRGVGSLLRGMAQEESPAEIVAPEVLEEIPAVPVSAALHGVPRWSFFAGDILLVGFAGMVAFNTAAPLDLPRVLFCAVATGVGAWLGIQPFLADYRAKRQQDSTANLPAWLAAEFRLPDGRTGQLLIHAHRPVFFARVSEDEPGNPAFTAVGVDGTPALPSEETNRLLQEAGDFYRRLKKN
jgi:hypothetical protein